MKQGKAGLKPLRQQLETDKYWVDLAKDVALIEVMMKEERREKYFDMIMKATQKEAEKRRQAQTQRSISTQYCLFSL